MSLRSPGKTGWAKRPRPSFRTLGETLGAAVAVLFLALLAGIVVAALVSLT